MLREKTGKKLKFCVFGKVYKGSYIDMAKGDDYCKA
jgi:hypothetical protein